jgi:hypothetical protein
VLPQLKLPQSEFLKRRAVTHVGDDLYLGFDGAFLLSRHCGDLLAAAT